VIRFGTFINQIQQGIVILTAKFGMLSCLAPLCGCLSILVPWNLLDYN
jgi:hypothetical protein